MTCTHFASALVFTSLALGIAAVHCDGPSGGATVEVACIGSPNPCPKLPVDGTACATRSSTCEPVVIQRCHYDCSKVFPGTTGTIDGTCALGSSLVLTQGACVAPPDAGATPDADAAMEAGEDADAAHDAATDG